MTANCSLRLHEDSTAACADPDRLRNRDEAARSCRDRWGPRTLVVAAPAETRYIYSLLAASQSAVRVIGCLEPAASPAEPETDAAADDDLRSYMPIPIIGTIDSLEDHLRFDRVEQLIICLPLALGEEIAAVEAACEAAGIACRFLPTPADQLAGRVDPRSLMRRGGSSASLDLSRLIDRKPRPLDEQAIAGCLTDRVVLITGAGGSIGSELARMVCRFAPARIVLVERSENALFEIDRELAQAYPHVSRTAELHDVTQPAATLQLVMRHRPHAIFHAAAHKHVPMMEDHPGAAVENNLLGTRSIADAADAADVDRFVMISSDKAVNPSSVMGATKRLAELYIQHLNTTSRTTFSMVRFGNVLGSACSVLPIWSDQMARGGPVTVTHPDMCRYFMTIPEAAGLVLQAGAQSSGGEVFLLDMGEPIRIVDLARRFIQAQGYEPDVEMPIRFTGIRPGEKLFEELAYDGEDMLPTPHAAIRIWRTRPPDAAQISQILTTFDRLRNRDAQHPWAGVSREAIIAALRASIPEMVAAAAG